MCISTHELPSAQEVWGFDDPPCIPHYRRIRVPYFLLDSRGASAVVSDEEVAVEEVLGEEIAVITRAAWYQLFAWRPGLIVDLLESVERSSNEALTTWSKFAGVELIIVPAPDW